MVELLVAMTLFGILMVAFLSLFMSAFSLTLRAGDRDTTLAGISGKVEKTMADEAYADSVADVGDEVAIADGNVTIIFGNLSASTETIPVKITTGIGEMDDGTEVIIKSFETAATPTPMP